MPVDLAAYQRSSIDWDRLRRYARKVAKETRLPMAPDVTFNKQVRREVTRPIRGFLGRTRQETRTESVEVGVTVLGPHWAIDRRHWHHEKTTRSGGTVDIRGEHEWATTALLPNGDLTVAFVFEEELVVDSVFQHSRKQHEVRPINESDVLLMDHHRRTTNQTLPGGVHLWTDRQPGPLNRHAKGVGLNLALKDILEGCSPRLV